MIAKRMKSALLAAAAIVALNSYSDEAEAANREVVRFRASQWKSAHYDDAQTAQTNLDTFVQIGCEANAQRHGGHFDVRYRCVQWRSISLSSHEEAHAWERWLQAYGFETAHEH